MIKTIILKSNIETKINIFGGIHVIIKNLSDSTVYVSKYANVVAENDEVKSIQSNTTDIFTNIATYSIKDNNADYYGTIYALSTTDCKIEIETTNNSNFRQVLKGGDSEIGGITGDFQAITTEEINSLFD